MAAVQVTEQDSEYYKRFYGRFTALRKWEDLADFWTVLKAQPQGWYIYAPGETPPDTPVDEATLNTFIDEIDELLRREHDEDYCNIVYVDDRQQPDFIKIYDPNNLGVSCGFSDNPPLPGWVLSRIAPIDMPSAIPQPGNRKRWWKKIFGG